MRCLCLAETAQIRWNLIFDGDEKLLAMVAGCTFRRKVSGKEWVHV